MFSIFRRRRKALAATSTPEALAQAGTPIDDLCNQRVRWVAEGFSGDLSLLRLRAKEVACELEASSVEELATLFHSEYAPPPEFSQYDRLGQWMTARQFAIFEIFYNLGESALPVLRRTAFGEYDWTQGNAIEVLCRLAADGLQTDDILTDLTKQLPSIREEAHLYALGPLIQQASESPALQRVLDRLLSVPEFKYSYAQVVSQRGPA